MTAPRKNLARDAAGAALFALAAFLLFLLPPRFHRQSAPVSAVVERTDDSRITAHGFMKYGPQLLETNAGAASNELRASMELDRVYRAGDRVLLLGAEEGGGMMRAAGLDLSAPAAALALAFALLLVWFAGMTGVKALVSFAFSVAVVWKLLIPAVLAGWSAVWVSFGAILVLAAAIDFLVAGFTRKGVCAFAGSALGILAGLAAGWLGGAVMRVDGAALPCAQPLIYNGFENLDLRGIFLCATMLSCSGAAMDLAMDVAAGVEEVRRHNPALGRAELVKSGMRIGRAVVGTMSTTLLLAYSGGSLTLLMMFCAQGTHPRLILSNPAVAAEVARTMIGSFAMVAVAPFTALVSGLLMGGRRA